MTDALPNVSSYRDRHGKLRWRYRKGQACVQLPGAPGEVRFQEALERALSGRLIQRTLHMHPERDALLDEFAREVIGKAKYRANAKIVPFALSMQDVREIMESQNWQCAISGVQFLTRRRSTRAFRPSLDRITPSKGYVPGNVRIVALIVNMAMNQWGEEALWTLARLMAERLDVSQSHGNVWETGKGSPLAI